MSDYLALFVRAEITSEPNSWLSIVLPLGIAVLGLAGTIAITFIQLRARRKELQDDRAERASIALVAREERERDSRASAIEDIVSEIAAHATVLSETIASHERSHANPEMRVAFPSNFKVKRAVGRLTTRAHERRLTDASLEMLRHATGLSLAEQPFVYGILQERLEYWFTGERTIDETVAIMASDADLFKVGKMPPMSDPLY